MKIVPDDFIVPEKFEVEEYVFRPLAINDVIKDYDAVMSSINILRGTLGINKSWPSNDLTLEQNLIDLGWHQKEFQRKTSFVYVIWTKNYETYLGCLYVFPSRKIKYDVEVYFWLRSTAVNMDKYIFEIIYKWIKNIWPFKSVVYPGRTISWDTWNKLKDK